MVKNNLRETGYAEEVKCPNKSVITAIWAVSALGMMVLVFISTVLVGKGKNSGNAFFDFLDDLAFIFNQVFQQWKFLVYLLLWAFVFLILYFITKHDLREQTLPDPAKAPKRFGKYVLGVFLVLSILAAFFYLFAIASDVPDPQLETISGSGGGFDIFTFIFNLPSLFGPVAIFIYLVLLELLYMATKFVATTFVCQDKKGGIHLQILKGTSMPVCSHQEALSIWHIIVAYLTPLVFTYSFLLGLCAGTGDSNDLVNYTIVALFMSFFMAYDLTLVLYAVYMKIRYKMDYISIDNHIYEATLFKKSYLKPTYSHVRPARIPRLRPRPKL